MVRAARSTALCYHAISAEWDDPLAVILDDFERQIRSLLRRGFTPVTAEQVLRGESATFHVTFDDGYVSIRGALDVLHELGVPATLFVCSALADEGKPLMVPELADRAVGHEDELATMTWSELRELSDAGVEIGSHTETHPHLVRLGERELLDELRGSRERMNEELGRPPRFIAYPYGESDMRIRASARRAGYEAAFGIGEQRAPADLFAFPRADIYRGTDALRFRAKTGRNGGSPRLVQAARRVWGPTCVA